nr:hypothetical transcript [Hymenolepis microstoma]
MSFGKQLKRQRSAVSATYSADYTHKKSLVYDQPASVNQEKCYTDCLKEFVKLRDVDPELKRFEESLFSPNSLRLQMCSVYPVQKRAIDEQVRLFLFMIDKHIRSSEAPWALEWLVYKYEVPRHYTDDFMRLLIPHYESGLFIKALQVLDYNDISSDWLWLKPYAERGTPLSRHELYRACCNQTTLIPFIAKSMDIYTKFESELRLNRISNFCNFFTYTLVGIFELELPIHKKVKIVNVLQGTLRKGLRSDILAFKCSVTCVVLRIACSMTLNHELVLDWINCLLKTTISGNEWNAIQSVRHLMKSQGILILPDELGTIYANLLNELSPLERAVIEQEEENQLMNGDVSALATTSLEQSERVQKSTIMVDVELTEPQDKVQETSGKKKHKKLTLKRVLKMSIEQLFSRDPPMQEQFELVHRIIGTHGVCVVEKPECECLSNQSECDFREHWLADFLISTLTSFSQSESLEQGLYTEDADAMLVHQQCKAALQIVKVTFTCSKNGANISLMKALNKAFLCVLSALIHPVGEVRVVAYETLGLYLNEFGKVSNNMVLNYVNAFLTDLHGKAEIITDSTKSLLQGDSLSALVRTTTDLVQAVFRLFCRQPLKDDAYSQMCWFSAAQLFQNDLLSSVIQLGFPSSGNGSGAKCGWSALLQLLKGPPFKRFEVVHLLCLNKLDAFTLPTLRNRNMHDASSIRRISILQVILTSLAADMYRLQASSTVEKHETLQRTGSSSSLMSLVGDSIKHGAKRRPSKVGRGEFTAFGDTPFKENEEGSSRKDLVHPLNSHLLAVPASGFTMSFGKQLKRQRSAVSATYSADYTHKKSLVYDQPASVNQEKCYTDCLKEFVKLRDVDPELKRFEESLFSPNSLRLQMCSVYPVQKRAIDEQVRLFLFMIDKHIRSSEAPWALEWLVYKYEVPRHYTDDFMRLLIPHYESGLFIKALQVLDYNDISSDWLWLKPYAERGTPLSRHELYRACCNQTTLIPFIAKSMDIYTKFESELRLNRISNFCNFFTYTLVGIFELELPIHKKVKIVNVLQGTLRKGLRSDILAFKCSVTCVVLRIACSMTLNHELVLDWINCLLKTTISGNEWNAIQSVRHLMKSQGILILPDELGTIYANLLNELSPLERAVIEQEEENQLMNGDVSALATTSLEQSERVQKSTIMVDVELTEPQDKVQETSGKKKHKKLTLKRVLKMSIEQLFSRDPPMQEQFELVHRIIGTHGVCVVEKPECECLSNQSECDFREHWLADFLISTLTSFSQSESLEQGLYTEDADAMLVHQQCKAALQIVKVTFTCSKNGANISLMKALNKAFLCVLSALIHPVGEVRVVAYETLGLYLNEFGKVSNNMVLNYVNAFLTDLHGKAEIITDSTKSLLQGDSLSALVRTTTDLVQAVFRLFCRQPLKDDAYSQMCWFSAAQLFQNDLLSSVIQLGFPSSGNGSGAKCGWSALLQLLKGPPFKRFEVVHLLCLNKLDAFTLPTLRNRNMHDASSIRRISILQVILTSLAADMYRLQASSTVEKHETLQRTGSSSSLMSLVGDSIKHGAKRRPSKVGRGEFTAFGDTPFKENEEGSSRKDLVHPLNSHLLACIQTLESGGKHRKRVADETMSTESDSDEGVVDDDHNPEPKVSDSTNLQGQALTCLLEIKSADKSKCGRKSPLMPSCSVKAVMGNIFSFLNGFEPSVNVQRQAVLCLVEMASLFPVTLCEQLLTLIKWIGGTEQRHSVFLQIDNVHNLHLMDRLISTAIPALLKVSSSRIEAGLKVLDVFVRGLPDLPTNYPRRCLTLYVGLVRGLADVTAPTPLTETGINKRVSKQFALSGWLWTAAIAFFNTNYPTEETANFVPSLLMDLFNQFELTYQLGAWQQCFKFYLYLISNPSIWNLRKAQESKSKRPRLDISREESWDCDYDFLLKHLSKSNSVKLVDQVALAGRKRSRSSDWIPRSGDEIRLWPLLANVSAFFTNLLETPGHRIRQQNAVKDSLNKIQEYFEDIVPLTVQLLISSTTSSIEADDSEDEAITRKDAIVNLQSLLVKMNGLMSSEIFLRAVGRLMSFEQTNLTRKALELLLAKLESLTVKCPNAAQLLTQQSVKPLPPMENTLKEGLVDILGRLSSSIIASSNILTSDRNATLQFSCLQKLAQLLCEAYPEKMVKILDHLLSIGVSNWWPSDNDGVSKTVKMATEAADVRSMVCLFVFTCLGHLPPSFISIRGANSSVVTRNRIRWALRFALDHASVACGLADRPMGSTTAVAGALRSREQHLQAGVTLVLGAFEFSTKANANDQSEPVLQVLSEEVSSANFNGRGSSETLDASLIKFVFRTTNLNLAVATKANAERSSVSLKQSTAIINRLRNRLVALPESVYSLRLAYDLLKDAKPETDSDLLSGGLEFISRHADRMLAVSAKGGADLDASSSGKELGSILDITYASEPLLVWNIICLCLECHPVSSPQNGLSSSVAKAAGMACASLLAALNHNNRLQLIGQCLRWLVLDSPSSSVVMARLESFFAVLHILAFKLSVQAFLDLIKETFLPHLFICTLSLLSGEHSSKKVKMIADQLELSYLATCFSSGISRTNSSIASSCARATYAAITAWLQAEAASSTCLDTAGTEAVLALPQIIVQPLSFSILGLTEIDLVPCVDAFLRAIGGDEALLRPFGSSLCALLRNPQWQIRLAGVHLLRQTFEILTEGDNRDLGLVTCLQSDMYTALTEAMEDNKPEVEAAANRLFADLEDAGATMANRE